MADVFVVGAVFEIDPAPAVTALESIGRAFESLADLATSLQEKFAAIGLGAFEGLLGATERASTALNEQIAQVDRLTAAYDRMAAAAGRSDLAESLPLGERRKRNGSVEERERERVHGRASISEHGVSGHAMMDLDIGTLAAGWGFFKSEESAMEEQKNITETLAGVNVTPDDPKFKEDYDRLHTMLYEKTKGTKYSNLIASKIMLESLPTLGLSGSDAIDAADKTDIFQTALNAGELSAFRGKGEPGSEAKASFQFAHLTGEWEPDKMSKLIDMVNAIAFRTGTSIAQQESIMKYAAPIGLLAGMPTQDVVGMVGAAENRLGDTSTAGTGFSQFILGGMAWKGETAHGLRKHQQNSARAAERELEAAIKLNPTLEREHAEARTQAGLNRHDQAIVDLKIRDKAGHLLPGATDKAGDYSEPAVELLIRNYAKDHTKEEVTRIMSAAFETRGERFAQPFTTTEGIAKERQQMESYKDAPTVKKELETLQNLPIQQFEQMLSNLANTGNILATQTLNPLNAVFKRTNELLIGFNDFLTKHQGVAEAVGGAALGGLALGGVAVGSAVTGWVWNKSGLGALWRGGKSLLARGAAVGAEEGGAALLGEELLGGAAAGAAAGAGLPLLGIGAGLLGLGALGFGIKGMWDARKAGAGSIDWSGNVDSNTNNAIFPGSVAGPRAGTAPVAQVTPPPVTINMTNNNTLNGVPEGSSLRALVATLTSMITDALSHSTSDAHGTPQSAFVTGGGF